MIHREIWNIFSCFSLISIYMSCGSFHKCVNHRAVSKNAGFRDTIEEIHEQYHSWEMEIIFSYFSESCVYKRIHLAPCEYSNCLWNNLKYWRSSPMGIHFSSNYLKEMDWRIHFQGNDTTIKNAIKKNQVKYETTVFLESILICWFFDIKLWTGNFASCYISFQIF